MICVCAIATTASVHSVSPHLLLLNGSWVSRGEGRPRRAKIRTRTDADQSNRSFCTVRASASQGRVDSRVANLSPAWPGMVRAESANHREIALDDTLCFDTACSNHLMVSPPLRGSNPYPCGSLTYRILYPIVGHGGRFVNRFGQKNTGRYGGRGKAVFSSFRQNLCPFFWCCERVKIPTNDVVKGKLGWEYFPIVYRDSSLEYSAFLAVFDLK